MGIVGIAIVPIQTLMNKEFVIIFTVNPLLVSCKGELAMELFIAAHQGHSVIVPLIVETVYCMHCPFAYNPQHY